MSSTASALLTIKTLIHYPQSTSAVQELRRTNVHVTMVNSSSRMQRYSCTGRGGMESSGLLLMNNESLKVDTMYHEAVGR